MKISIITSVPSMINNFAENTMIRKAIGKNIIDFHIVDVREFSDNNYKQIDDNPYGGGDGMVLMAEPLMKSIEYSFDLLSSEIEDTRVTYPSLKGKSDQNEAQKCISVKNFIFICGRYKGIDQRVIDKYVTHGILSVITLSQWGIK